MTTDTDTYASRLAQAIYSIAPSYINEEGRDLIAAKLLRCEDQMTPVLRLLASDCLHEVLVWAALPGVTDIEDVQIVKYHQHRSTLFGSLLDAEKALLSAEKALLNDANTGPSIKIPFDEPVFVMSLPGINGFHYIYRIGSDE
jgi:hypothetical protein